MVDGQRTRSYFGASYCNRHCNAPSEAWATSEHDGAVRAPFRGSVRAMNPMTFPFLSLGQSVATPGAPALLAGVGKNPAELLARHQADDRGKCRPKTSARTSSRFSGASVSSAATRSARGRKGMDHPRGRPLLHVHTPPRGVLERGRRPSAVSSEVLRSLLRRGQLLLRCFPAGGGR